MGSSPRWQRLANGQLARSSFDSPMYRTTLALLMFALSPAVPAQTANPHNGTWKVLLEGFPVPGLQGTVVVKDEGGTYTMTSSSRTDACVGIGAPITVQAASPDELVFKVNRSKVLTGCSDFTWKFKNVDDKTMKAQLTEGLSVTLTRN